MTNHNSPRLIGGMRYFSFPGSTQRTRGGHSHARRRHHVGIGCEAKPATRARREPSDSGQVRLLQSVQQHTHVAIRVIHGFGGALNAGECVFAEFDHHIGDGAAIAICYAGITGFSFNEQQPYLWGLPPAPLNTLYTAMKPYSEACDQNKVPILKVLREVFKDRRTVLEIGSGTGQHAVYFGSQLSHLIWQPSDLVGHHAGIMMWLDEYRLANVHPPIRLDVDDEHWPEQRFDAVFSANTAHIMSWPQVERMFAGVGSALQDNGVFALYGPFNYRGGYTSDSNARFDQWLKAREPSSGIWDFEALDSLAHAQDMILLKDYEMPVNNHTLVWRKSHQIYS